MQGDDTNVFQISHIRNKVISVPQKSKINYICLKYNVDKARKSHSQPLFQIIIRPFLDMCMRAKLIKIRQSLSQLFRC